MICSRRNSVRFLICFSSATNLCIVSTIWGVVNSLIGQRNSIAVVVLYHVPELQADTSFLDLLDIEAAEAVIFVADARNCLDSGKVAHEIFVDGTIEYFGESTRG